MSARGKNTAGRSSNARGRSRTDWKRVAALTNRDIERALADDPDAAPLLDAEWFATARLVDPLEKERITIRLDKDILDFFRRLGPRYQTRINSVLRAFVAQTSRKRKAANPPAHND